MRSPARLALLLGAEVLAWLALTCGFLYAYVGRYSVPASAIPSHLEVIAALFLAVSLLRLAAILAIPAPWARAVGAVVLAGSLGIIAAYYALVLTGLQSWGRVVSWQLMASYAGQLGELMAVLGIPRTIFLIVGVALLGWIAAVWFWLGRFDWTREAARAVDGRLLLVGMAAAGMIVAARTYQFLAFPPIASHEPVSLTLFPVPASRDLQGHAIDKLRASRLDQGEDQARAEYSPAPGTHRTNVILIVVDALRPDHMGLYGYARQTTPNLQRMQAAGVVRKAAVAHASCGSSACGLLSLASSKYVHEFSERPFTLQQALRYHGYRIHMMLSGDHTSYYSLKESYGEVDSYFDGYTGWHLRTYFNDDQILLDHLANFPDADGKPVMIQFHLMSAHLLGKRHSESLRYLPATSYAFADGRDASADGTPGVRNVNYYDNGVLQTDAMVQRLLDALKRKGYLDNALVAVTADHGEGLGEHGVFQHASDVYEQTLRIPFVLLSFGRAPGSPIDARPFVSQVDIAPTILRELGMPVPRTWSGVPMQVAQGKPFTYFQERTRVGMFDHREPAAVWKYWTNSATGAEHAFELVSDPSEKVNAVTRIGQGQLQEWRRQVLPGLSVQALPYELPDAGSTAP